MKKIVNSIAGLVLACLVFAGVYFYLSNEDKDYDSLMKRAEKKQKEHSEFLDFYGEREPSIPDKDENSKTLIGIDLNANGIRDDIDVWINRSALTMNETMSMRQYARAMQEWFNVCDKKSVEEVKVVKKKLEEAQTCLTMLSDYKRLEVGYAKNKLELLIMNTPARSACREFYSQNDIAAPIAIGEVVNFSCEFEVQYPQNVVSGNADWKKS